MKASLLLLVQLAAIHPGGHVMPLGAQKEMGRYKDSTDENCWNDTHTSGQIRDASTEQREMEREVSTEDFEEFTDEMTETSAGSVKVYPKYNNKFAHGRMGRGTIDDWAEFTDASTASWLTGKELTTESYDDFTAKVMLMGLRRNTPNIPMNSPVMDLEVRPRMNGVGTQTDQPNTGGRDVK
ncbi:unnamed protein product [Dicrocoelium dendriticum]|nr:unnamed protein product [Dicrocoelium dendriticum]